jgi:hypothetical protein
MSKLEKIEIHYQVEHDNGGNIKTFTRVLELDYVAVRELRTSSKRKDVIQGLVGHYHPNYHVISGSIKSLPDDYEEKPKRKQKRKEDVYEDYDDEPKYKSSKSIWRKPYYWIPFRILWVIIKYFFIILWGIINGLASSNSKK